MTRYIPFVLYLLLIAMHEVIWRDFTVLYLIAINVPAMLVVIVAIYKSELTAAWFGFLDCYYYNQHRRNVYGNQV